MPHTNVIILMGKMSFLPCYVATDQVEAYHAVGRCAMTVRVQHTSHHRHFDISLPHSKAFSMLVTNLSAVFALKLCFLVNKILVHFRYHYVSPHTPKAQRGIQPLLLYAVSITQPTSLLDCLGFVPDKPDAAEMCHGGAHKMQAVTLYWLFLEQDILTLLVLAWVECAVSTKLLRLCTHNILVH